MTYKELSAVNVGDRVLICTSDFWMYSGGALREGMVIEKTRYAALVESPGRWMGIVPAYPRRWIHATDIWDRIQGAE